MGTACLFDEPNNVGIFWMQHLPATDDIYISVWPMGSNIHPRTIVDTFHILDGNGDVLWEVTDGAAMLNNAPGGGRLKGTREEFNSIASVVGLDCRTVDYDTAWWLRMRVD